jgi:A/G-specific adenine glycosylase
LRKSLAFWIEREGADGIIEVMLRRRPPTGLLGGMLEIPVTDWKRDGSPDDADALAQAPEFVVTPDASKRAKGAKPPAPRGRADADKAPNNNPAPDGCALNWRVLPGIVRHGFTHFELETTVLAACVAKSATAPADALWWPRDTLDSAGLPTVMWKVAKHVAERG